LVDEDDEDVAVLATDVVPVVAVSVEAAVGVDAADLEAPAVEVGAPAVAGADPPVAALVPIDLFAELTVVTDATSRLCFADPPAVAT